MVEYIPKRPRKPISLKMQMHLFTKYAYNYQRFEGGYWIMPGCNQTKYGKTAPHYRISVRSRMGCSRKLLHNAILDQFGDEARECRSILRKRERERMKGNT